MTKLSTSLKQEITADWAAMFPTLGVYKPMWLLRRVGPLAQGICLNRDSSNERYQPILHAHNLAKPHPSISLTLADELRTVRHDTPEKIKVAFHRDHYVEAANRMNKQALLPLVGDLRLDQVLMAYKRYMARPLAKYPVLLFEDIITTLLWCGRNDQAKNSLSEFETEMRTWPTSIASLQRAGGIEAWTEKCGSWIKCPDKVRKIVEQQIEAHGLEQLPNAELIA